jgi:uncharacterized protein YecE (DUF72 family)
MGDILIGTCSWTDPTLIKSGRFYPEWAKSAEGRLQFYASQFNIVEVDSSYYALPNEKTSRLWVERTAGHFIFDIKAFRLFTQHPTPLSALPKDLREELPADIKEKASVYLRNIPPEAVDELWGRFESALLPLDSAGKLGTVLFQFPPWFYPGHEQRQHILACKERLPQYRIAVEFRHNSWVNEKNRERTMDFLRYNDLPFVCVDEPQGFKSSVPPMAEATSDVGLVRFHGRNKEMWERKGISAVERFNYLYNESELGEWVPRIKELAQKTRQLHVLFNNCYADKAVVNARQIGYMLD